CGPRHAEMSQKKKQIRAAAFRSVTFARDGHRCVACGKRNCVLDPITSHGGYVVENGISLCEDCHKLAEAYHATGHPRPGYSPAELYARINSSYDKAYQASLKLGE